MSCKHCSQPAAWKWKDADGNESANICQDCMETMLKYRAYALHYFTPMICSLKAAASPAGDEKMNYQVKWNEEDGFENVYPDGYGMHEEHVADIENVKAGEAHILHGNGAYRFHEDSEEGKYVVSFFPQVGMPDNSVVFSSEYLDETDKFLARIANGSVVKFDDDYECSGCWSPETGDPDVWFAAIFEQGAYAARCGSGCVDQYEYTADEFAQKHAQV